MDRYVVFVDARYVFQKGVQILSHNATKDRRCLELTNPQGLIQLLIDHSKAALDSWSRELLRLYWYDEAMPNGPTPQQQLIRGLPDVTFRACASKVSSTMSAELLELASNHAVTDAAVVSGDRRLATGIELAQKQGVRIAAIGIEDGCVGKRSGLSREIAVSADRVRCFDGQALTALMRYAPPGAAHVSRPGLSPEDQATIEAAVDDFILENAPW